MKKELSKNIYRYRKEKGLTQEELANKVGLSYQAISKWETGQTSPDISILPELARIFEVSIEKLLGYITYNNQITIYEERYKVPKYYILGCNSIKDV